MSSEPPPVVPPARVRQVEQANRLFGPWQRSLSDRKPPMITVGLIGLIAGGKSEVCRLLAERGAAVVDVDRLAHQTYARGGPALPALVDAFGPDILTPDGSVDRRKLGALVFNDPVQMKRLTDIVWPATRDAIAAVKREHAAKGTPVLVIEAAVLLEAGWRDLVDEVWFVRAPLDAVRERLMRSRGLSAADVEARIAARPQIDAALAAADLVIDNDGDLEALERKVDEAWQALLRRNGG